MSLKPPAQNVAEAPPMSMPKPQTRESKCLNLDGLVHRIQTAGAERKRAQILEWEAIALCARVSGILREQGPFLEIAPPVQIIGDIHGQLADLLRLFGRGGWPSATNQYVFLGDYVDRGRFSVECVTLLFTLKALYPSAVHLLRGNHECSSINRVYGFYDDCKLRYRSLRVWKSFGSTFNNLPISGVVGGRILCVHGGLSPDMDAIDGVKALELPIDASQPSSLDDLLWSDPDEDICGWGENDRGTGFCFGADVLDTYLKEHDLDLVCRGHQVVQDGYQFFGQRRLVTIFSASNYCNEFDNAGAMMCVSVDMICSFIIIKTTAGADLVAPDPSRKTMYNLPKPKAK